MLNYIGAEFYKAFRRKYVWITLAAVLALEGLLAFGFVYENILDGDVPFSTGASVLVVMLNVGFFATLITGDMVFAAQYKNNTLKNEVSFGLSRVRVYLGKLIVMTALSLMFLVVMSVFYLGLCWVTLNHEPEADRLIWETIGYCLLSDLPLWLGVQACVCAMYFLIGSELGAAFVALAIFAVAHSVLEIASLLAGGKAGEVMMKVYTYLPMPIANTLPDIVGDWTYCGRAWLVGMVWLAGFTLLGLIGFRGKEIK